MRPLPGGRESSSWLWKALGSDRVMSLVERSLDQEAGIQEGQKCIHLDFVSRISYVSDNTHFLFTKRAKLWKCFGNLFSCVWVLCDPVDCGTAGLPCPSPSPGVCSNSCPLSWYAQWNTAWNGMETVDLRKYKRLLYITMCVVVFF